MKKTNENMYVMKKEIHSGPGMNRSKLISLKNKNGRKRSVLKSHPPARVRARGIKPGPGIGNAGKNPVIARC